MDEGIKGWACAGEEYVALMDEYEERVWRKEPWWKFRKIQQSTCIHHMISSSRRSKITFAPTYQHDTDRLMNGVNQGGSVSHGWEDK